MASAKIHVWVWSAAGAQSNALPMKTLCASLTGPLRTSSSVASRPQFLSAHHERFAPHLHRHLHPLHRLRRPAPHPLPLHHLTVICSHSLMPVVDALRVSCCLHVAASFQQLPLWLYKHLIVLIVYLRHGSSIPVFQTHTTTPTLHTPTPAHLLQVSVWEIVAAPRVSASLPHVHRMSW